jgi:WD40 repeat protein
LIRVFLTTGLCERLFEFRRGSDTADIYSISFSFDSGFISVSSDKGTVHLYGIRDTKSNRKTALSHAINDASGDLSNFKADNEYPCICTFSDLNHVVAASFTGTFHKYIFTGDGKCNREEFELFLDGMDGCDF